MVYSVQHTYAITITALVKSDNGRRIIPWVSIALYVHWVPIGSTRDTKKHWGLLVHETREKSKPVRVLVLDGIPDHTCRSQDIPLHVSALLRWHTLIHRRSFPWPSWPLWASWLRGAPQQILLIQKSVAYIISTSKSEVWPTRKSHLRMIGNVWHESR